ncbi:hypothetical protein IF1G_04415 [Cordyceps javanica]|uniref:Uncharacterized protein n=1 Tax=Cordyceps javanica TaxID=43265 RepID=A0A545V631_9HYPO|nr:hypothetical protein IF1G_04415 [Cordyceps javanica]
MGFLQRNHVPFGGFGGSMAIVFFLESVEMVMSREFTGDGREESSGMARLIRRVGNTAHCAGMAPGEIPRYRLGDGCGAVKYIVLPGS